MRTKKGQTDVGSAVSLSAPTTATTTTTTQPSTAATTSLKRTTTTITTTNSSSSRCTAKASSNVQKLAKRKKTTAEEETKSGSSLVGSTLKVVKIGETAKRLKKMVVVSSAPAAVPPSSGKTAKAAKNKTEVIISNDGRSDEKSAVDKSEEDGRKEKKVVGASVVSKESKELKSTTSSVGKKGIPKPNSNRQKISKNDTKEAANKKMSEKSSSKGLNLTKGLIVSKELKNLGINLKDYHENLQKSEEMIVLMASAADCKTSICESVKTKSRNQSIYSPSQFPIPDSAGTKSNIKSTSSSSNPTNKTRVKPEKLLEDQDQSAKQSNSEVNVTKPELNQLKSNLVEENPSNSVKHNSEEKSKPIKVKSGPKVGKAALNPAANASSNQQSISKDSEEKGGKKKPVLKLDKKSKEVGKQQSLTKGKLLPKKVQQRLIKSESSSKKTKTVTSKPEKPEGDVKPKPNSKTGNAEKITNKTVLDKTEIPTEDDVKQEVGKITVKSLESLKNPEPKEEELSKENTELLKKSTKSPEEENLSVKRLDTSRERKVLFKRKHQKKEGDEKKDDKTSTDAPVKKEKTVYDFDSGNDDLAASPKTAEEPLQLKKDSSVIKIDVNKAKNRTMTDQKSSKAKPASKLSSTKESDKKSKKSPVKPPVVDKKEDSGEESTSSSASSESSNRSSVRRNKISKRNIIKKQLLGQKRHRVASLNALAKVQCLYENESRSAHELGFYKTQALKELKKVVSGQSSDDAKEDDKSVESSKDEAPTRSLRNAPGLRAVGKHWEMNDMSSSDDYSDSSDAESDDSGNKVRNSLIIFFYLYSLY